MKVYAVSSGFYSDYTVHVLFTDKALADAHAEATTGRVEEFEMLDKAPERFMVYSISNSSLYGVGEEREWAYSAWSYQSYLYKRVDLQEWGDATIQVTGTDHAAVRKTFYDRKAQRAAEKEGIA